MATGPAVGGVLILGQGIEELALLLRESSRTKLDTVGGSEPLGPRFCRLVEGGPTAQDGFERGHARQRIPLPREDLAEPLGSGAEHHRAVLQEARALASLGAA